MPWESTPGCVDWDHAGGLKATCFVGTSLYQKPDMLVAWLNLRTNFRCRKLTVTQYLQKFQHSCVCCYACIAISWTMQRRSLSSTGYDTLEGGTTKSLALRQKGIRLTTKELTIESARLRPQSKKSLSGRAKFLKIDKQIFTSRIASIWELCLYDYQKATSKSDRRTEYSYHVADSCCKSTEVMS